MTPPWAILLAIIAFVLAEWSKKRERRLALQRETYLAVLADWARFEIRVMKTPVLTQKAAEADGGLAEFAAGLAKLRLTASHELLVKADDVGRYIRENYTPLLDRHLTFEKNQNGTEADLKLMINDCLKVTMGIRRKCIPVTIQMRKDLGLKIEWKKFENLLLAEADAVEAGPKSPTTK